MTEKLYWNDPFALVFEATVRAVTDAAIVLDRTAFYPEGGGQLADRGVLRLGGRELPVTDVQIDDDGTIRHLVEPGALAAIAVGTSVEGQVDRARRRDFMSQHTGQHALSRALIEVAKAETVSSRLGEAVSTIDTPLTNLDEAVIARAEDLVNELVLSDVPVRTHFPTPEELARMPLRRAPKVSTGIRVVEIEGFDFTPCGGTHVAATGQIGAVRVTGVERYKGGTRVTFLAGQRTLADARDKDAILRELARAFTCGTSEIPAAVGKLRADLKARTDAFAQSRGELVQLLSERVLAEHPPDAAGTRVHVAREGDDLPTLRALAGALARRGDVIAFVSARDAGGDQLLVVERGSATTFDCGAWFKKVASGMGGRGGGRPDRAEGRLPGSVDLGALVVST